MSADALTGKMPRCAAQRFVAKGADEQCLNEPHDLATTRCRFASDSVQDEADRIAAELVVARRERDQAVTDAEFARSAKRAGEKEIARLLLALREIAFDPHCISDPSGTDYGSGVVDGHRCAATKARTALGEPPR